MNNMNVFLSEKERDVETAIMLEQALVTDIGKAVAYTDGEKVFINTDDNLYDILPDYNPGMLKWLLWHERYHVELRHHNRFFKYLEELSEKETEDKFSVTKQEVNIIMDVLVHDSLSRMFPELIETAEKNLAQMRDRNSLGYTFETFTLEEMLSEYAEHKKPEDDAGEGEGEPEETTEETKKATVDGTPGITKESEHKEDKETKKETEETPEEKGHDDSKETPGKSKTPEAKEDKAPEVMDTPKPEPRHEEADWSKLEDRDEKEFIDKDESNAYVKQIERIKRTKFKLGKLTETLNGLATSTRRRTYAMPSSVYTGGDILIKGSQPGKTLLYLCFDASGSMGREMDTFKDIISKSIPQAMQTPTAWFSGWNNTGATRDPEGRSYDYHKGTFQDFMRVHASSGYDDDGDRTIELCWKAEQLGYSPIGITDGGGRVSWSKDMIKQLKRTLLVGSSKEWLETVQKINPKIQILDI